VANISASYCVATIIFCGPYLNRIDVERKLGTTEIWEITSVGMPHPFHVHGALFRILSLDDKPPPDHLAGW
jgi:blue copper oxidase